VEWEVIKSDDLDMNEGDKEEGKEENPPAVTTPSEPAVSTPTDQPQTPSEPPVVDDVNGEKEENNSLGIILGVAAAVAVVSLIIVGMVRKKKGKVQEK
jgi:hypothetical protein